MSIRTLEQLSAEFNQHGAVLLHAEEIPLSGDQWRKLEALVRDIEYVKIVGGDTGDAHSVWVGRFVNDVEKPELLHASGERVLQLLMDDVMQRFFTTLIGAQPLCIRRCQANRLFEGDFIGYHLDQDTTPDYMATAVFQFSDGFDGGEFVLHHPQQGNVTVHLPRHSVLLNRGDIPHQVLPVTQGMRQSLACFFSTNFGVTNKPRNAFKIDTRSAQ